MSKRLRTYVKRIITALALVYVLACVILYFFQEKILFHPEKVNKKVTYTYSANFEERFFKVEDEIQLNALLFKADSVVGERKLVFYIHGNAENLTTAGGVASSFTDEGYDFFVYDFRGFGKSDGHIDSEARLFADAQILYSQLRSQYGDERITIVGYSIGTGIASWLAANNHPERLILQAPYFSMKDMMHQQYPIFPSWILKYPLETNLRLQKTTCPIYIFHGTQDDVIPYASSTRLKKMIPSIDLTSIPDLGHTGFMQNPAYQTKLSQILKRNDSKDSDE